jgi:hypothetical protein
VKLRLGYPVLEQDLAVTRAVRKRLPSSGKPTLKLVLVVGTKYIDYFTDGTKTTGSL